MSRGSIEVDFANGYPSGQSLTLTLTVSSAGAVIGSGSNTVDLEPGCTALQVDVLAVAGAPDLSTGADLALDQSLDLALRSVARARSRSNHDLLMPLANGDHCNPGDPCGSGHCVDGVCCDTACTGQCQACDLPDAHGKLGTCSTVMSGGVHGTRTACTDDGSGCGGACAGDPTQCGYPTHSCGMPAGCTHGAVNSAASCSLGKCPSPTPLVNLRVFRNRNFAIGCMLIACFGAALYGLVTLLPLFYQELMGYTALNAGIAVSPRGIGAIVAMPVIGLLTSRLDNRYLISFGFFLFGVSSLWFAHVDLQISQWSLLWPIILSGFGSGCVFVPLSTTALAGLRNEEIGNASGLYNLLRNIGGSIGISIVNTIVARHEQVHRAYMVHWIDPTRPTYQQQLQGVTTLLKQSTGPNGATLSTQSDRALGVINGVVNQQARLWSYVDDFRYLAFACFLCVPIVFLLRKAVAKPGAVSAAH